MPFMRDRLKTRRLDMGLTLQEVADIIGVEKPTVQRYESGKINKLDTATVEKLASSVRCDPAFLMGWTNAPSILTQADMKSEYEKIMMTNFRSLNEEGQEKAVEYMADLVDTGKYKKQDKFDVGSEQRVKQA